MSPEQARKILEINGALDEDKIKSAFLRLSQKYHPDKHRTESESVKELLNEKFQQIKEARDVLLQEVKGKSSSHSNYTQSESEGMVHVNRLVERRQFSEAIETLRQLRNKFPHNPDLISIQMQIHNDIQQYEQAYNLKDALFEVNPRLKDDPDFLSNLGVLAAHCGKFQEAHNNIDEAMEIAGNDVPSFIADKATVFLLSGDSKKADELIAQLARIDPNHPLVRQRNKVWNVQGNYVGKKDATQASCCICAILELIFDCC